MTYARVLAAFCFLCVARLSSASWLQTFGDYVYDHSICNSLLQECCRKTNIPADFDRLRRTLDEKVYGQHVAKEVTINALKAHWDSPYARKALTLSFHGRPGTGKNYIVKFIAESLYKNGAASKFVHNFKARIHFAQAERVDTYKTELYNWIKGNVTKCPYQLFVFDEVDHMPAGILDVVKPLIDYNDNIEKVDYRKSVFVFLSNTGGEALIAETLKLWSSGVDRESIALSDFDRLLSTGAFNEAGGFQFADAIKSNLIDHYVPFLPMELEHVRRCVLDEFAVRGVPRPDEKNVLEVLDFIGWGPKPQNKFANTGCKRLSQHVASIVVRDYSKSRMEL